MNEDSGNEVRIRYIVNDVDESIEFYTQLGFAVTMRPGSGFAALARGAVLLFLNEPGAGGAGRAVPGRGEPRPGGWNRFQLVVGDLEAVLRNLDAAGLPSPGDIVEGRGGKQALLEDPSGNLVEIFQPSGS